MSASPLPALNIGSPTTAAPSHAASTSQADQARQRSQESAFNTRLQDARRQQSSASGSTSSPTPQAQSKSVASGSPGTPSGANTSAQATSTTSNTTSGASAAANGVSTSTGPDINAQGATDTADSSSAEDAATTSLAATVLGLIDQSSGNAAAPTAGAPSGKVAKGKTQSQVDNGNPAAQLQPGTTSSAGVVIPVPIPALAGQAAVQSDSTAATSGAVSATAVASNTPLALMAGTLSSSEDADTSDAADADATNASTDGDTGAGNLLGQIADGAVSAAAGALFGAGHAALSVAAASTATDSQPQNGGDLAAMNGALSAPALATPTNSILSPHTLSINAPVNSPAFSQELGQHVAWLGSQDIKQAQIRLNPQELGPLDVKVSIEHGRVDVTFMAQHPATVAAVQQSLSQLNQMLGGHGLSLGQATVGQQASQQHFGGSQGQSSSSTLTAAEEEPVEALAATAAPSMAVGLVDAFA